jgi:hypothetical protein
VLDAEFERRSPERYRSLHRVVHDHVVAGLRAATGLDRQLLAQHLLYLHRRSPLTRAFYALRAQGSAAVVPARRDEHAQVLSILEGFEGAATARLAEAWLAEQPDTLSVVRDRQGWPPTPTTSCTRPARRWRTATRSPGPRWPTWPGMAPPARASRSTSPGSRSTSAGRPVSPTATTGGRRDRAVIERQLGTIWSGK